MNKLAVDEMRARAQIITTLTLCCACSSAMFPEQYLLKVNKESVFFVGKLYIFEIVVFTKPAALLNSLSQLLVKSRLISEFGLHRHHNPFKFSTQRRRPLNRRKKKEKSSKKR